MGLLGKMILYYSLFGVIVVCIMMGVADRYLQDVSAKNAEINRQQLAEKLLTQVEGFLSEMNQAAVNVVEDIKIIELFQRRKNDIDKINYFETNLLDGIDAETALTIHNQLLSPLWRISVFNRYGDFISSGAMVQPGALTDPDRYPFDASIMAMMYKLSESEWGNSLTFESGDHWSRLYGDTEFMSILLPLTDYYGRETYGIVEVQQEASKLRSIIQLDMLDDTPVFVFDRDGVQVIPASPLYEDVAEEGSGVTRMESAAFGWSIALVQDEQRVIQPYRSIMGYIYIGSTVAIIVQLLLIYMISKRLSDPIIALSKRVRTITMASVPESLVDGENTDEIQELNASVTSIVRRMHDSLEGEKRSYLMALQSQMNPHFLYNTLAVISGMNMEGRYENSITACGLLSDMLRYSTNYDTHLVTLNEEITHISNYLQLMKLRFEDFFSYSIDVDETLYGMMLPKLTLQPFVENCFEHGFRTDRPPWEIHVEASHANKRWIIRITDNGVGISDPEIRELERRIEEYRAKLSGKRMDMNNDGIGLANTITRLKLLTNDEIGYRFERNKPAGTVVTLWGDAERVYRGA